MAANQLLQPLGQRNPGRRLAAWSKTLKSRGVELVPVSVVMPRASS